VFPNEQSVHLNVEEVFRGPQRTTFDVEARGLGGSCDYEFADGRRYLVFAVAEPDGTFKVLTRSGTKHLEQATEDLAYVRGISTGRLRNGRVNGSVYSVITAPDGRKMSDSPSPGILVILDSPERKYTVPSDLRRLYELGDVASGSYTVRVQPPPNFAASPSERILIRAGECVAWTPVLERRPRQER
jgi:hypothetical protein